MKFFFLFLLCSCSTLKTASQPSEGKKTYTFADVSGKYALTRDFRKVKQKVVTRSQITTPGGAGTRSVEKSVMVSQLGSIKDQGGRSLTMRPYASEFVVWLEGKKYSSNMKLDPATRSMILTLDTPEAKWKGTTSVKFPKGKLFCFYNQIPECLGNTGSLAFARARKGEPVSLYVLWDSYPFIQDIYTGVGKNLFAPATLKFEKEERDHLAFQLEVDGQVILYHFSKSFDLVRMFWIAQGVTVLPPGEEVSDGDE